MNPEDSQGLLYVIASTGGDPDLREARAVHSRLSAQLPTAESLETRETPGALWGFIPTAPDAADRVTRAESTRLEVVLRGDPVWTGVTGAPPCDAQTLLEQWESEGSHAAEGLDNLFLAAVVDKSTGELFLKTDRTGGIRLYAGDVGKCRLLCTSSFVVSKLVNDRSINREAISVFFHLGYYPDRSTALTGVEVHPFGSMTSVSRTGLHVTAQWKPTMSIDASRRAPELLEETVDTFNQAVKESSGDRKTALLAMTAGLDSRCIASSLLHQKLPFTTYTHGFPGCWEAQCVERIVKRHSLPHRFVPLTGEFTDRIREHALSVFRVSGGEIGCLEKSHLNHVLSVLSVESSPSETALLLGGGAGTMKGAFYRLMREEDPYSGAGIDRYVAWNFRKRQPDVFSSDMPVHDPHILREFVRSALEAVDDGSFHQRLDYLFLVRYRRWASAVKDIYRRYFGVREPFMSSRLLDLLFSIPPSVKKSRQPHFEVLRRNWPSLRTDLTNTLSPALPFDLVTWPRFLPSAAWRVKQVLRGLSRRYLPWELFPLVDYVDYGTWIRSAGARALTDELLDPDSMRSIVLYDGARLREWLARQRQDGFRSYRLVDRMCTLELLFREIGT